MYFFSFSIQHLAHKDEGLNHTFPKLLTTNFLTPFSFLCVKWLLAKWSEQQIVPDCFSKELKAKRRRERGPVEGVPTSKKEKKPALLQTHLLSFYFFFNSSGAVLEATFILFFLLPSFLKKKQKKSRRVEELCALLSFISLLVFYLRTIKRCEHYCTCKRRKKALSFYALNVCCIAVVTLFIRAPFFSQLCQPEKKTFLVLFSVFD